LNDQEITRLRLRNQRITQPTFEQPADVVDWLGAVQAQDYYGAKWSLGLRMRSAKDGDIDRAFNDGSLLRTHLLRPTWHFVTPMDIRWLLALTAPQVHKINAHMYRQLELDQNTFKRSNTLLEKALHGGNHLTRNELRKALEGAGIEVEQGLRMSYFMMYAELDGLLCSGPRRGKQFTYALLEERVPQSKTLLREEALAELAHRYFTSRGPATMQDFAKWSGLTVADARDGLEAVKSGFQSETIAGQAYWFSAPTVSEMANSPSAQLLSVFDEYVTSYKDRSAMSGQELTRQFTAMGNALQYVIVIDGRFVGTWKRTIKKSVVAIHLNPFIKLSEAENKAVADSAQQYGAFLQLPVVLEK